MQEQKINQYLKEIINTMTEGLMVASTDGTILMVNQAFEKIMGYRQEEIIGHSCAILNCDACARLRSASKNQWCDLFDQGMAIRKVGMVPAKADVAAQEKFLAEELRPRLQEARDGKRTLFL